MDNSNLLADDYNSNLVDHDDEPGYGRMKPEIKSLWLEALRSDRFQQGIKRLATVEEDGSTKYCCLGVLCVLAKEHGVNVRIRTSDLMGDRKSVSFNTDITTLPPIVQEWAGLSVGNPEFFLPEVPGAPISEDEIPANYSNIQSLAQLNDSKMPFSKIADVIEWVL